MLRHVWLKCGCPIGCGGSLSHHALLQQSIAQLVGSLRVSRLHFRLGAESLLGLWPLRRARVHEPEFEMKPRGVWSEPDRLLEFLFRLWHLPQDIIVFGHGLMGTRRVRIIREQRVDGLLGE